MLFKKNILVLIQLIIGFSCIGCSSKIGQVQGKVTQNNALIDFKKTTVLQIIFLPVDTSGKKSYPADFDKNENVYKITKIPNGRYKVAVSLLDPYPNNDKLRGKYTFEKTPLFCQIEGDTDFDINISLP